MNTRLLATLVLPLFSISLYGQNGAPYWSLSGNNNATLSNKIGTTNNVSLRFVTNNIERMKIHSGGNVGIGTTSPSSKLHIAGSGPNTTALRVANGGVVVDMPWSAGDTSVGVRSKGGTGLHGTGTTGVYGNGSQYGVYALSNENYNGSTAVYGKGYFGVEGEGVVGMIGRGTSYGVRGYGTGSSGYGVLGQGTDIGVYGNGGDWGGYFVGSVYTSGSYQGSDRKLKQNIRDIPEAIALIGKLQPKEYEFRQDGSFKQLRLPQGKHYGLIAQELEQVLPTLVKETRFNPLPAEAGATQKTGEQAVAENISFKTVNYTEMIPLLVKAIQEQQSMIEELKAKVNRLEGSKPVTYAGAGLLGQNIPNPTHSGTRISYTVPAGSRAQLLLTDAGGKTVKTMTLAKTGFADIDTAGLSSGIYHYSLLIDGKIVETKRLSVVH